MKTLWNRACLGLDLIREEMQEVTGFTHTPTLPLMLRWLLMQEAGLFQANPYLALALQAVLREEERPGQREDFEALLAAGENSAPSPAQDADPWRQWFRQRLRVFLWQDRDTHYDSARIFALYLKASGAAYSVTRAWLEEQIYAGRREFAFLSLADEDLAAAHLRGARFRDCDFTRANLSGADLRDARFDACRLEETRLDDCRLDGVQWLDCLDMEQIKTDPATYEKLFDNASRQP